MESQLIVDEYVAKQFRLVDKDNRTRALFTTRETGDPAIDLLDAQHCHRISVQLQDDKPYITLYASNGEPLISAGESPDNESVGAIIKDLEGRPRLLISIDTNGATIVRVYDLNGNVKWFSDS